MAGNPRAAMEIYDLPAAGECFPDRRLTVLGQAWYDLGDLKKSAEVYRESIRRFPKQPQGYLNYASILSDAGHFFEAEKFLDAARNLHPKGAVLADLEYNAGQTAQRTRRMEKAEKHYLAALAAQPQHRKALNNLGTVYIGMKKPEKALPLFEKAARLEPENTGLQVNLALSLAMTGREREAAAMVTEILRRDPECVPARRLKQALDQR